MKRGLLVVASLGVVAGFAWLAHGQGAVEINQPIALPSFSFDVAVGPATGAIHIPPTDPPSRPYQAVVTVAEMSVFEGRGEGRTGGRFISDAIYAGGQESISRDLGSFEMHMTVEIDADGERAEVTVSIVRKEDDLTVASHRFVAYLPDSQRLR
jgi:hypothetical protein